MLLMTAPRPWPARRWHPSPPPPPSPTFRWCPAACGAYPVPQSTTHAGSRPAISPRLSVVYKRLMLTGKRAVSAGGSGKPSTGGTRARSWVHFSTSALGSWQAGRGKMAEAGGGGGRGGCAAVNHREGARQDWTRLDPSVGGPTEKLLRSPHLMDEFCSIYLAAQNSGWRRSEIRRVWLS